MWMPRAGASGLIWPLIRQALPAAELHCYGSYGDKVPRRAACAEGWDSGLRGAHEEALATMAHYRVNCAPLRYGAGLKGKLFDGFETGTPTVTTPVGAEGVTGAMDWGCAISVRAATVCRRRDHAVCRCRARWSQVQAQGQQIAKERFAEAVWLPRLPQLLGGRDFAATRERSTANTL